MTMMMMKRRSPGSSLPPGFRFHPTDEELIIHYLHKKLSSVPFPDSIIADVDIYKFDPWDLPAKAAFGEKEWYFFSPRDRKYPNGARPNRAAASGYWKATGTDKLISAFGDNHNNIGIKKALVFYKGKPPKGIKTNWIMHEYRLSDPPSSYSSKPIRAKEYSSMRLDDWVLCRIYKKTHSNSSHNRPQTSSSATISSSDQDQEEEDQNRHQEQFSSTHQQALFSFPSSKNHVINNNNQHVSPLMPQRSSSFSNVLDATDQSLLNNFLYDSQFAFNSSGLESIFSIDPTAYETNSTWNDGYLYHKLPQLQSNGPATMAPVPNVEMMTMHNRPKRERSIGNDDLSSMVNPLKKAAISSKSHDVDPGHMGANDHGFLNYQTALNQQLLLSHHLQFQG